MCLFHFRTLTGTVEISRGHIMCDFKIDFQNHKTIIILLNELLFWKTVIFSYIYLQIWLCAHNCIIIYSYIKCYLY